MPWIYVKMYFCEDCGRSFGKEPPETNRHYRQAHDNRLPGVCHGRIVYVMCKPWVPVDPDQAHGSPKEGP